MKKNKISYVASTLLLTASLSMVGCGSDSSSDSSGNSGGASASTASGTAFVSGTTATPSSGVSSSSTFSASTDSSVDSTVSATLVVDSNNNEEYGDDGDTVLSASVGTNGAFDFGKVPVSLDGDTKVQLTVNKKGYAPYTKIITLSDKQSISVVADASSTPLSVEAVNLTDLRAKGTLSTSFLKLGTRKNGTTVQSYARVLSFSQMQAEADVPLQEDFESESIIPLASIPDSVTVINAEMQTFDPTDPDDAANFPGEYVGVGENGSDEPQRLVSVGFDYMSLTDQNGDTIELDSNALSAASKLLPQAVDYTSCLRTSTSYLSGAQLELFKKYGDDDNTTEEFEIPLWAYNSNGGNWQYLGQAEVYGEDGTTIYDPNGDDTYAYAKMCITENWGTSVNLDYSFAPQRPATVCVNATDQNGNAVSDLYVTSQKDTAYEGHYLNDDGKATFALLAGTDVTTYKFSYSGSLTGWNSVDVNSTEGGETGCDSSISIKVINPYSATLNVNAKELDGTPAANKYVYVYNSDYSDYYSDYGYTDENGLATFNVKPNTAYVASYNGADIDININGTVVSPEQADDGRTTYVNVQEEEVAPNVSVYMNNSAISDAAQSANFSVSAWDDNGDAISLSSLTLNGTTLVEGTDYTVDYSYNDSSYAYFDATLNLESATVRAISPITPTSLEAGSYTLIATYSDTKGKGKNSSKFTVTANRAPVISSAYFLKDGSYNYITDTLSAGTNELYVYAYDPDGDAITETYTLDGNASEATMELTDDGHTLVVTATDTAGKSSSRTFEFFVGNHAPEITSFGASTYSVDLTASPAQTFTLYAYASDRERSKLTMQAKNGDEVIDMTPFYKGSNYFSSNPISISADTTFTITANDGDRNSTAKSLTVTTYRANQAPLFTQELTNATIEAGTTQTFTCLATDPDEDDEISYSWSLNGVKQSSTTSTFTNTFATSSVYTVSCTATDDDVSEPASVTSTAIITVFDPTASGNLIINTLPGLVVSLHDTTTLAPTQTKTADANGQATFAISGSDRTTFSVSVGPDVVMTPDVLFENEQKWDVEYMSEICNGYGEDEDGESIPVLEECSTFDPVAILESSTIPNWLFQINLTYDFKDADFTAEDVDTSGDGEINSDELYTKVLAIDDAKDGNNDGKITWGEWEDGDLNIRSEFFVNVPVGTYNIDFDSYGDDNDDYYYDEFDGYDKEPTPVTVSATGFNPNLYINGRGSLDSYIQLDENGTGTYTGSSYLHAQNDGLYSTLFSYMDGNGDISYAFMQDKSETEITNISLVPDDFSLDSNTNVTIIPTDTNNDAYIEASYKGITYWNVINYMSCNEAGECTGSVFNNPALTYFINNNEWYNDEETGANYGKSSNNYYAGALQSSYDMADYPNLDIDVSFDAVTESANFNGQDLALVNYVSVNYEYHNWNEETEVDTDISVVLHYTVAPTSVKRPDLEVILPESIATYLPTEESLENNYEYVYADILELKDTTEAQMLDMISNQDYRALYNTPSRSLYVNLPTTTVNAKSARTRTVKAKFAKPFSIGYDLRKVFAK